MKKNRMAANMPTPTRAAIAMPATVPRLSGEESPELLAPDEHALPAQDVDPESLEVIVTISCWEFSFHEQADTLKVFRS